MPVLTHPEARAAASRALDDSLPRPEERELAVHLVACPDCKRFYDELRWIRSESRSAAARRDPPAGLVTHSIGRATAILRGEPDPGPAFDDAESTGELKTTRPAASQAPAVARPEERADPVPVPGPVPAEKAETITPFDGIAPPHVPRRERRATRREEREASSRRGPLLLALVVVVAVTGVAALVFTRGDVVRTRLRPVLPSAVTVRHELDTSFDGIRTLRTSYRATRLGLYRQPGDKVVLAFTTATETGRVVFEAPARLRDERTLDVAGQPKRRTTFVHREGAVDTTVDDGTKTDFTTVTNPPSGPPDGPLLPRLGSLEPSLTSVSQLLAASADLRVLERATIGGRRALRVSAEVAPTPFTRADRIEALLDERSHVPLKIERTISRANAAVLGPKEVLREAAIDAQFAGRDRITSETIELTGLTIDEPVQPGEFLMSPPEGAVPEPTDAHWLPATERSATDSLKSEPLVAASAPRGYRDAGLTVLTGRQQTWGPRRAYPAAESAVQSVWWDGQSTIVLSQRRITRNRDRVTGSPLAGGDLPIETREVVRNGRRFQYATGPDVPPHVYGFVGDVFVMASGYALEDDLVQLVASLGTSPTPAPEESQSPGADSSPERGSSPSPEPASSPRASRSPLPSPAPTHP